MEFIYDPFVSMLAIFSMAMMIYYKLFVSANKLTKRSIIVFSRYPVKSRSKTRLIPDLGPTGAAETQLYMTEHLIDRVIKFCEENPDVGVYIYYLGGEKHQVEYWLGRRGQNIRLVVLPQLGENLSDRLMNSAEHSFDQGDKSVVIVGSDIPGIDGSILSEAFNAMATPKGTATVLGAAKDGAIFDKIDWGTEKVFQQQVDKINQTGLTLHLLSKELNDVDLIQDMPVFEREVGVNIKQLKHPTWSIIIPVLNEENSIVDTIKAVLEQCSDLKDIEEIIVSDGGSTDGSVEKVKQFARATEDVKIDVVNSPPGINEIFPELPYGDQSFCMKKFNYDNMGGFDRVYLLEDVLMVEKCKRIGHIVTLPEAVTTSGRRWEQFGAFRVTFLNFLIMVAYKMGVSPDTLAVWYYGDKLRKIIEQNRVKAD